MRPPRTAANLAALKSRERIMAAITGEPPYRCVDKSGALGQAPHA
jgi:hypothetical protein